MSLNTLKKKAETKYFNKVSNNNTFSINGTLRNQGYVGQTNLSRSVKRTPYSRNGGPVNHGTKGNFSMQIYNSGYCPTNDNSVIKNSVINNKSSILNRNKWIRRPYPFAVAQPDANLSENASQGVYIHKKGNNHTCVKDETKELKDKSCTSNIACHRRIGGRLVIRSVYAKTFSINKDQSTHTREIQKTCINNDEIYPPRFNGDGFHGCKGCGEN